MRVNGKYTEDDTYIRIASFLNLKMEELQALRELIWQEAEENQDQLIEKILRKYIEDNRKKELIPQDFEASYRLYMVARDTDKKILKNIYLQDGEDVVELLGMAEAFAKCLVGEDEYGPGEEKLDELEDEWRVRQEILELIPEGMHICEFAVYDCKYQLECSMTPEELLEKK